MERKENDDARYTANGYKDRDDYLASLADDRGYNIQYGDYSRINENGWYVIEADLHC